MKRKQAAAARRVRRVRSQVSGTAERPRLAVFRSLVHISAQVIDDTKGVTLVSASDRGLKGTKTEKATAVGTLIAEKATAAGITTVTFDRRGNQYHGRVAALAAAARAAGLQF